MVSGRGLKNKNQGVLKMEHVIYFAQISFLPLMIVATIFVAFLSPGGKAE
jgi:hypothetical protein